MAGGGLLFGRRSEVIWQEEHCYIARGARLYGRRSDVIWQEEHTCSLRQTKQNYGISTHVWLFPHSHMRGNNQTCVGITIIC
jgi:hypothetical protein